MIVIYKESEVGERSSFFSIDFTKYIRIYNNDKIVKQCPGIDSRQGIKRISYPYHVIGIDIGLVGHVVPFLRCDHDLLGVFIKICTPPAEAGIGDDVMTASAHNAHVYVAVRFFGFTDDVIVIMMIARAVRMSGCI